MRAKIQIFNGNLINLTSFGGKALVNKLWPLLYKRAKLDLRLTNGFRIPAARWMGGIFSAK